MGEHSQQSSDVGLCCDVLYGGGALHSPGILDRLRLQEVTENVYGNANMSTRPSVQHNKFVFVGAETTGDRDLRHERRCK